MRLPRLPIRHAAVASAWAALAALQSIGIAQAAESAPVATAAVAGASAVERSFNDCAGSDSCPTMVRLPGGPYLMGSPKDDLAASTTKTSIQSS